MLLGFAALVSMPAARAAAQEVVHPLAAQGHQPHRGTYSVLPWESIDMASGNVTLTFTDVDLPGNAGMNLQVQRVFNLNTGQCGIGVPGPISIGMGGTLGFPNPAIAMMDGSQQYTFQTANPDVYLTHGYWRLTKSARQLALPNGLVYQFDHGGDAVKDVTKLSDPFGNAIEYGYNGDTRTITQSLDGETSRTVTIVNNASCGELPTGWTCTTVDTLINGNHHTWTYKRDETTFLREAIPPTGGPSWTFSRTPLPVSPTYPRGGRQFTVTTPHGGTVEYYLAARDLPEQGPMTHRRDVLVKRTQRDRGASVGSDWEFAWPSLSGGPDNYESNVTDPSGVVVHYGHIDTFIEGAAPRIRLTGIGVVRGGVNWQTTRYRWTWDREPEEPPDPAVPVGVDLVLGIAPDTITESAIPLLLDRVTIERQTYGVCRTHDYRTTEFNDYGNPSTIVEMGGELTGSGEPILTPDPTQTRTSSLTYKHDFERYIRGRLTSLVLSGSYYPYPYTNGSPYSYTWSSTYDAANGFVTSRTALGQTTTYAATDDGGFFWFGNVAKETDANGHATSYRYSKGVVSEVRAPLHTLVRDIKDDGTINWEVRQNAFGVPSVRTEMTHDALGRETLRRIQAYAGQAQGQSQWQNIGADATTDYDQECTLAAQQTRLCTVSTRGPTTVTTMFDGFGRTVVDQRAVPVVGSGPGYIRTAYGYDAMGRRTSASEPFYKGAGTYSTATSYDALDRVLTVTPPVGAAATYTYIGSDVTITTGSGGAARTTTQEWHACGTFESARLVKVTDAEGKDTTYTYNGLGSLTEVRQTVSGRPDVVRSWTYDPVTNRLQSETHPESGTMTYSLYDDVGNLTQRYDARKASFTYTYSYDAENRLVSMVAPRNPSGTPSDDVEFEYDGWGNRSVTRNASVTRTFTYLAHRLLQTTDLVRPDGTAPSERRFTTRYEYDDRDNLTAIVYPSGRRIKYTVDSANRVTKVEEERSPGSLVPLATDLTYHASGALSTYTAGNDVLTSVTVDALSRPDVVTVGGTPLLRLDYGYDGFANVESLGDSQTTYAHAFTHDKVDRLLGATWGSETLTHTYDAVGNRLTRTGGTTVTYSYDSATNRLTSYGNGGALGYSSLGQVTSWTRPDGGGTDTYTYTQWGLIRTANVGAGNLLSYEYDADQLRTIAKDGGDETRAFVHGPGQRSITEYVLTSGQGATWVRDDIYLGDRLLASVLASSEVTVSGIDPDSSPVAGGTTVTITGTGFVAGATSVWIGGALATGVQVDGQGMTLTAVTPAHAPGPVEVVVTTAGGSGSLTGAFSYRNVALNRWLGSDSDYASDVSVYRPSTGYWYVRPSDGSAQLSWQFGQPAHNDQPLRGDFDGDGLRDPAVYRPASGTWFALLSDTGYSDYLAEGWGVQAEGDTPAPGDFDGDGKTDPCVFRPQYGTWFILESHAAYTTWSWFGWGTTGDVLMPGDYDGDGKTDGAVYRPSTGEWFIRPSGGATPWSQEFGDPDEGDIPLPGYFDGDGKRDLVVYRPSSGTWFWLQSSSDFTRFGQVGWGLASQGDEPVPGDYDGDGKTDPAVFRPQYGTWFILTSSSGYGAWVQQGWGAPGDIALGGRR